MIELASRLLQRSLAFPRRAAVAAAWALLASEALVFQGCGEEPEAAQAAPDPYAALDAAYPQGRPPLADVATREQDAEYMAQVWAGAAAFAQASAEAERARSAAEHYRGILVAALEAKHPGRELPQALVDDVLAKDDHYQKLLQALAEAEARRDAVLKENLSMIRAKMSSARDDYDARLKEADAAARAAGLPTRAEAQNPGQGADVPPAGGVPAERPE